MSRPYLCGVLVGAIDRIACETNLATSAAPARFLEAGVGGSNVEEFLIELQFGDAVF